MISIFLREQQHLALADKVRKIAEALHTQVCETLPDLSSSADSLASYLRRKPIVQQQHAFLVLSPPPSPSPSLSPSSPQDPYSTLDDNMVPAMVDNVLSLVSQLLPNQTSLLSAQGLHLFYNTLSSILPPSPSPYELVEEVDEVDTPNSVSDNNTVAVSDNNVIPNFDHPTYTFNITHTQISAPPLTQTQSPQMQTQSQPQQPQQQTPTQNPSPTTSIPSPSSSNSSPSIATPPITPPVPFPSTPSLNEPMEQIYTYSQDPNKNNEELNQIMSVDFPFPAHSFAPFTSTLPVLFRNYTLSDEPTDPRQPSILYAASSTPTSSSTIPVPSVTPMVQDDTPITNNIDNNGMNYLFQRVNNLIVNSNNNNNNNSNNVNTINNNITNNSTTWNQGINSPNLQQQSTLPHTPTHKGTPYQGNVSYLLYFNFNFLSEDVNLFDLNSSRSQPSGIGWKIGIKSFSFNSMSFSKKVFLLFFISLY